MKIYPFFFNIEFMYICLNYYIFWIIFLGGIWSNLRPGKECGVKESAPPLPPGPIGDKWEHFWLSALVPKFQLVYKAKGSFPIEKATKLGNLAFGGGRQKIKKVPSFS